MPEGAPTSDEKQKNLERAAGGVLEQLKDVDRVHIEDESGTLVVFRVNPREGFDPNGSNYMNPKFIRGADLSPDLLIEDFKKELAPYNVEVEVLGGNKFTVQDRGDKRPAFRIDDRAPGIDLVPSRFVYDELIQERYSNYELINIASDRMGF